MPGQETGHLGTPAKVIITCAVTSAIHTPSISPHLPVAPDDIAEAAIAAAAAGVAIVLFISMPAIRAPASPINVRSIWGVPAYYQAAPSVGSPTMRVEDRVKPAAVFKPEIASLNMGSMNFGLYPMLKRQSAFQV